ncbi:S8 family serine peptidase [Mesorhizobium sp. BHbsci]
MDPRGNWLNCVAAFVVAASFSGGQAFAGLVADSSKFWAFPPGGPKVIPVCWEDGNGDTSHQELVRLAIEESWQSASAVRFEGWRGCETESRGVRIHVDDISPHARRIGRALDGLPNGIVLNFEFREFAPTCSLSEDTRRRCIYATAVHEFGHALGFIHSEYRVDVPPTCQALQNDVGAPPTEVPVLITPFDPDSVMSFCGKVWLNDGRLTELDRRGVASVYGEPSKSKDENSTIGWQSRRDPNKNIGAQISDLYLTLFNLSQLPTRASVNYQSGPFDIEQHYLNQRLYFGTDFTVEMHALACDLNPQLCTREKVLAPNDLLGDHTKHVGGFLPSHGEWMIRPFEGIYVPNVSFARSIDIATVTKTRDQNIEDILESTQGCEHVDEQCLDLVARLNRGLDIKKDFGGIIRVPTLALTSVIDVSCDAGLCAGGFDPETARIAAERLGTTAKPPSMDPPGTKPAGAPVPRGVSGSDIVRDPTKAVKSLNPNLWGGISKSLPFSLEAESLFSSQRSVFDFISFPWVSSDYPVEFQRRVEIGIVEVGLRARHCDLSDDSKLRVWSVRLPAVTPIAPAPLDIRDAPGAMNCASGPPVRGTASDHGMHVVGIIGAQVNGAGIAGLNPFANIRALEYKSDQLKKKEYQNAFAAEIENLFFQDDVRVVNMSFRYEPDVEVPEDETSLRPTTDRLQEIIEKLGKDVLFVAAAGHSSSGMDLSRFCNVYPACLNLPNVISVAALEPVGPDSRIMERENFGEQVSIGALGTNILSTGSANNYVVLSGSSMAAPQVTAVASLLFAKARNATPVQVKNRILGCAKPTRSLIRKVWSGVLDATCALDKPDQGRLVLENPKDILYGTIIGGIGIDGSPLRRATFLDLAVDEEIRPSWKNIYALHRDPMGLGRLILFTARQPNAQMSELLRRPELVPAPEVEQSILFRDETGADSKIELSRIVSFVGPLN